MNFYAQYLNKYIESKQDDSFYSVIKAMELALSSLKEARQQWGYETTNGTGWRGGLLGLKLFYNAETTKKNIQIVDDILEESKKINYLGLQDDLDNFNNYVEFCLAHLSANGHTKELLEHILIDLKKIKILVDLHALLHKLRFY